MNTHWQAFATVDPFAGMSGETPGTLQSLVGGRWTDAEAYRDDIVDPLNGEPFLRVPDTRDFAPFIDGLAGCPKSGLHNPLRNNDRYVYLGRVCARTAALMATPVVADIDAPVVAVLGAGTMGLAAVAGLRRYVPGVRIVVGARYPHQRRFATELAGCRSFGRNRLVTVSF